MTMPGFKASTDTYLNGHDLCFDFLQVDFNKTNVNCFLQVSLYGTWPVEMTQKMVATAVLNY